MTRPETLALVTGLRNMARHYAGGVPVRRWASRQDYEQEALCHAFQWLKDHDVEEPTEVEWKLLSKVIRASIAQLAYPPRMSYSMEVPLEEEDVPEVGADPEIGHLELELLMERVSDEVRDWIYAYLLTDGDWEAMALNLNMVSKDAVRMKWGRLIRRLRKYYG